MMKTKFIKIITLLSILFILSGCIDKKNESSISVSGVGVIMAEPDMAEMTISLTHVASTTRQAQEEVNKMTGKLLEMLKNAGVEDRNIRTTSLSFRPEYQYINNRQTLVGQRAEQSMLVSVNEINVAPEKLPRILDEITSVDKVILQQINFSIKDRSQLFSESRELAYQKALDKAKQYASLAGLEIVKPLSISEQSIDFYPLHVQNRALGDTLFSAPATSLPTGELEVTSYVTVVFLVK